MPTILRVKGYRVGFYSSEPDEPVHVHGFHQGRESKAELIIVDGIVTGIRIGPVAGMRPLTGKALADFEVVVSRRAEDIVGKWVDFFVHHRPVQAETITRKLK